MPNARFFKLPLAQRERLLAAALDEFTAHGFARASLNRIIEAAQISKGSLYYYFEGKEDLYVHLAQLELGELLSSAGEFPIPRGVSAEEFWSQIAEYYSRLMRALLRSPKRAALARDWIQARASPSVMDAERTLNEGATPHFVALLEAGQSAGAVRRDLPIALMTQVVLAVGQAMDVWLLSQAPPQSEEALASALTPMVGLLRRMLSP